MKREFDIYKVGDDVFGMCKAYSYARHYFLTNLQEPNIMYYTDLNLGDPLSIIVYKYYKRVRGEERDIMASDLVWICRRELEIGKRVYI